MKRESNKNNIDTCQDHEQNEDRDYNMRKKKTNCMSVRYGDDVVSVQANEKDLQRLIRQFHIAANQCDMNIWLQKKQW